MKIAIPPTKSAIPSPMIKNCNVEDPEDGD
jgi:hypothetical protein